MISELTLVEKRAYQAVIKTGDIRKDLQAAGVEQEKIDLITGVLDKPLTDEGPLGHPEEQQARG
jgi:hypothetical protein